ncbi:Arm DNA-binding domain-containing protein [Peribacillus huizhouensis]|uniref:Arm DNA-binding domain-containing protein n=1 Tax=Peribacillus huizhouensis TaxID=1501239 RepID=UPI001C719E1E|nr:Arm DNA-binding domain-containing protein [Peribacillus huizhouensis]
MDPLTKKRKEISKRGFKTQREAKAVARLVELEIQNGTFTIESDKPFDQFAQGWLKTYSRSGVKISSVRAREKEMKHFTSNKYTGLRMGIY